MSGQPLSVKDSVRKRARNKCENCGTLPPKNSPSNRRGTVHHRKPRRLGGQDTISNMVLLCFECHRDVHMDEPAAARAGWIAWTDPEVTPVLHQARGWALLVPDGAFEPLEVAEALRLLDWVNGDAMDLEERLA